MTGVQTCALPICQFNPGIPNEGGSIFLLRARRAGMPSFVCMEQKQQPAACRYAPNVCREASESGTEPIIYTVNENPRIVTLVLFLARAGCATGHPAHFPETMPIVFSSACLDRYTFRIVSLAGAITGILATVPAACRISPWECKRVSHAWKRSLYSEPYNLTTIGKQFTEKH